MVKYARANHRFKTQTGQAERSITFSVDARNWVLEFYISPNRVTSGEYVYTWCLNDGTGTGYKQAAISPNASPRLKNGGIQADDFMGRAWDKYLEPMNKEVKDELKKAFK